MPVASPELVAEILASDGPYTDEGQKQICRELVEQLTEEEKEIAARTSYAYSIASTTGSPETPSTECQLKMAMRFARRHLVAEKGDLNLALTKMKSTLQWRKKHRIDELRRCFDPLPSDDQELMAGYRDRVAAEHALQKSYVSGFDLDREAVVAKYHRISKKCTQPSYLEGVCYGTERALACTEFASRGTREKVATVCDFALWRLKDTPKKEDSKWTIQSMQSHYPERLKYYCIVWCDGGKVASTLMKAVWGVVKFFLDPDTKTKIQILSSKKQRDEYMSQVVDVDQAMPFMLTGGTQTTEVDMDSFLRDCPFTCSADEKY